MIKHIKICGFLAAATLLFGCQKDDASGSSSGELISFAPATSCASTKDEPFSGIIQDSNFPTDRTFAMNSFCLSFDDQGNPQMVGGWIFMNMETVSYNSTDGKWHTANHHYWPLSGGLYCLGYYPSYSALSSHKMIGGISADIHGNLLFTGIDIKHSDASDNPITNDADKTDANLTHARVDLMSATTTIDDVNKRSDNVIPVVFTHLLTQLKFSVESAADYSSYEKYETVGTSPNDTNWYWTHWQQIWLDEIKITNIHSKGTYSNSAPHWPEDRQSEFYTYYPLRKGDRQGTLVLYKNGENAPRDDVADRAQFGKRTPVRTQVSANGTDPLCILLIPQRVHDDATIEIKMTARSANILTADKTTPSHMMNDISVEYTKSFKLKDFLPILTGGTSVNVNFKLAMDKVNISVSYDDWDNGGSSEFVI